MHDDRGVRHLTAAQRTIHFGDKELVEAGMEAIAEDLVTVFAAAGIDLRVEEEFEDDGDNERHVATIGSHEVVLTDFGEDPLAWDDVPTMGHGPMGAARTHMIRLLRVVRSAYAASHDGATWHLANLDDEFALVLATPDEVRELLGDTDTGWVLFDIA